MKIYFILASPKLGIYIVVAIFDHDKLKNFIHYAEDTYSR
jgi:hypothetical protein